LENLFIEAKLKVIDWIHLLKAFRKKVQLKTFCATSAPLPMYPFFSSSQMLRPKHTRIFYISPAHFAKSLQKELLN